MGKNVLELLLAITGLIVLIIDPYELSITWRVVNIIILALILFVYHKYVDQAKNNLHKLLQAIYKIAASKLDSESFKEVCEKKIDRVLFIDLCNSKLDSEALKDLSIKKLDSHTFRSAFTDKLLISLSGKDISK